ncbi:O-antigen ligase family protein [candidate division FCPU426 bacterium]|nr:O-antigen ligase family protein [candidate division FCPU426 bacterium]
MLNVYDRIAQISVLFFAFTAVASTSMQNIIFFGVLSGLLYMAHTRQWRLVSTPMNMPLLLLALILVVSSLVNGRLNPSLFGIRKVGLMVIFFATAWVAARNPQPEKYVNAFLLGASLCAVWSIISHFLGWDGGRARSFSGDHMAAGGMYMIGLLVSLARGVYMSGKGRWWCLGGAALFCVALLFTYTRSSWLGAAVGIVLISILKDKRLLVFLGVFILALFLFPNTPISQRASTLINNKYIYSNQERLFMWDTGWQLFKEHPFRGYGVDNLSRFYGKYLHPDAYIIHPPHVHNTLLQLGINGGILAVLFYLWWMLALFFYGLMLWRQHAGENPSPAGAILGITAAMLGFFTNGFFEFNFGTTQVVSIVYFLSGLLPAYESA